jgi:hypothetical protein
MECSFQREIMLPIFGNMWLVEMNLILAKLFHYIVTTNLHFICIHSPFLPWFLTHLTSRFLKTLDSWLFHITRIYTIKYIRNNITIHFIILWYYRKFTQQYEHKHHYRSLFFYFIENSIIIIAKFYILLK